MQNWDNMQTANAAATYEQHNNNNGWYNSMFAQTEIKTEPDTENRMLHEQPTTPKHKASPPSDVMSHLENYLRQHKHAQQQQVQPQTPQQLANVDCLSATMTPSPSNTDSLQHHVYDSGMQTQLLQQQHYQQQFQQAQQAAAHNQVSSTTPHLPLGFNPLTPPGLPTAIIPTITHFYHQQQQQQQQNNNNSARLKGQQTPSPQPLHAALTHAHAHMLQAPTTPMDSSEKLQSALTPRNTPPMDITPPKSPTTHKSQIAHLAEAMHMQQEKLEQQDAQSDTSDDMKYTADLDDDKMIREPIYNSHGKIKNYKCKSCGLIAITKVLFWEHARTHMKPEKILQCPKCPFVTELKHHLEYHIRKHKNLKPFQCDKCSYTCVNKSMLNSHRKSHSSVYQYRCADCDYATKYCHSFKLHLRKYDHKPGLVLDEEGVPNPSVVIDVYGTRRGPKSKGGASGTNKRSNSNNSHERLHAKENGGAGDFKLSASQLSAALQSFSMPPTEQQPQHQMPVSPAKSPSSLSSSSERQTARGLTQQQHAQQQLQQQQHQRAQQQQMHTTQAKLQRQTSLKSAHTTQAEHSALADAKSSMSNLLPPLASILQQNPNMAFFPYWNLNLQMLAAQQQAAALAQMPSNMREQAFQELQNLHANKDAYHRSPQHAAEEHEVSSDDDDDDDDAESVERKSTDSAMDLSQGSPVKEDLEQRSTPAACGMQHEETSDTPIVTMNGAARRKGRMLKLDALMHVQSASAESLVSEEAAPQTINERVDASPHTTPTPQRAVEVAEVEKVGKAADCAAVAMDMDGAEVAEVREAIPKSGNTACTSNTSTSSTASSSGNSSNGSSTASNTSTTTNGPPALGTMYECKYCDIYFKDAVLYTIHMGYHSCDDVFKCNMCGEKCDGPVGLFVHMARNAHS